MRILIPSTSPARVEDGVCRMDRKFHTGMCRYADVDDWELTSVVRLLPPDEPLMDAVEVPVSEMRYRVETVACDRTVEPESTEEARIEALVRDSQLVYGMGLGTERFARRHRVPYIAITEYSLPTQLQMALFQASSAIRRVSRQVKTVVRFARTMRSVAASESVHCNGYPTLREVRRVNANCLMYLDSRMSRDDVIEVAQLRRRLLDLEGGRRPRLLFSGRYEAVKGALDVVEVGVELLRMGVNFELHLYGKGDQRDAMLRAVKDAGAEDRIQVHDAIPFPQLVKISRTFDLFVCCHLQGDPSCTYLESMGAGLPVIGYANEMWRAMATDSSAGVAVPQGDRVACATAVAALLRDRDRLTRLAGQARAFALDHCFEDQFEMRVEHVQRVFAQL